MLELPLRAALGRPVTVEARTVVSVLTTSDEPMRPDDDEIDFGLTEEDCEEDEQWFAAWEEEQGRRYETCAQRIIACHAWVERELGEYGGPDAAWELFAEFLRECRPKPKRGRPRGKSTNTDRDAALLKAHREAPPRAKLASVVAAGHEHRSERIASLKQLARLRKGKRDREAQVRLIHAFFAKVRPGDPSEDK
jgi:hypothetical protein